MARGRMSNPFISIRPFSAVRRRKNNGAAATEQKANRKVSIDHTVLSRDDSSRGINTSSQDFSRSFDGDAAAAIEVFPSNNFAEGTATKEQQQFAPPTKSHSEPSFLCHHPNTALCPCQECSPAIMARQPLACSMPPIHMQPVVMAPPQPLPPNTQHPTSPKSNTIDPALKARIEAIRIQQRLLGENHPDVIFALSSLAKQYKRMGYHAEAEAILRESRARNELAKSTPQFSPSMVCNSRQNPQEEEQMNVPTEIFFNQQS